MTRNVLIVCICAMLLSGCGRSSEPVAQGVRARSEKPPEPQEINFAKMILERKQYQFEITRDPFEPLDYRMAPEEEPEETDAKDPESVKRPDDLDALLLGVVRTNRGFEALLQQDKKRKTARIGDEIDGYRVHRISFLELELAHIKQPDHRQVIKRKDDPAKKGVRQQQDEGFDSYFEFGEGSRHDMERSETSWENEMP